ncbi:filamentous haemagglutinin family protein [Bradyrhizobium sp. Ai1a-2]|uniref:filamentous haemagglutinin family protein n=1 Tax=Bradyrhizobium sp. Ai1a-2 TaxID=196490 RepID=UPI000401AA78|nr:filamentous haemagglutinin family protein [Bradyrhizobium sp. Ai1a-2]
MLPPVLDAAPRSFPARRLSKRALLFAGVSAVALFAASHSALSRPLGGPAPTSSVAAMATAQATAQAAQQAMNSLKQATQSIQAMQAAQQAARDLVRTTPGTVPNGLRSGGLVVMPGATPGATDGGAGLWQGANLPTESSNGGRTQVTVKQNEQKAILTWKEFNVGRETDLYFDQRAGGADASNWIALNRVGPGAAPSQILGSIKADGQVYVINQNGIIFGGASQVNVGALVASSLSLSNQQFMAGINNQLKIFDDPSGSSIAMPAFGYLGQQAPNAASISNPSQVPGAVIGAPPGDVRVEAGAQIGIANGGKAMLFAPHVINAGHINVPDGQVIMAAGEQVYLMTSQAFGENERSVRGLDVAVSAPMRWVFNYTQLQGAQGTAPIWDAFTFDLKTILFPEMAARVASVGYRVANDGIVQADRGNITVMARDIAQNGGMFASTALNNRDGSIRLRAWDQGMLTYTGEGTRLKYWSTGAVRLGVDSVTSVMPDLSDTSEMALKAKETRYTPGRIELHGQFIDIQKRASVIVPAGTISVVASTSTASVDDPQPGEVKRDGSRVYIDQDAYLSVAGLQDVLVPMERNLVTGEFRINELRDSPLYRESWLRGKKVTVDRRVSGVFTDGPMAGVLWGGDPGEWQGTPLGDFSGWIGVGKTTLSELSTTGGSIAIKSSGSVITRPGSLIDVSGGSVRYLDGWINTTKLLGADGRIYDISQATPDRIYVGFAGGFTRSSPRHGVVETWTSPLLSGSRFEKGYTEGRNAGSIRFYASEGIVLEGDYWGGTIVGERQLASGKLAEGGTFRVGSDGDTPRLWLIGNLIISRSPVLLPEDFTATTPLDTSWYDPNDPEPHRAKTTYLNPEIMARSGMGTFQLFVSRSATLGAGERLELAPGTDVLLNGNTGDRSAVITINGTIRIAGGTVALDGAGANRFGAGAAIDVSGQWTNDLTSSVRALPPVIDGGSIQLHGDLRLSGGSGPSVVFDVSGGGWLNAHGIKPKLQVGDAGSIELSVSDANQFSQLDLRGYAAGSGGKLTIGTSGAVQVGGDAATNPAALHLPDTLFAERGFRSASVSTSGSITVPDGAVITRLPYSVDLTGVDIFNLPSDTQLTAMGRLALLPLTERVKREAASLSLSGSSVTIGKGAVLQVDVGGTVNLQSTGDVVVRGTIEAPGGAITISTPQKVTLANGASLLARGVPVIEIDAKGLRSGTVLNGGSVEFKSAPSIRIEPGALIDVSGASGEIDVMTGGWLSRSATTLGLASDGGKIALNLKGAQDLIEGRFLGYAGGNGAVGGSIDIRTIAIAEADTALTLPTTIYYRDKNTGTVKSIGTTGNLDIYKEYSTGTNTAYRYLGVRTSISTLTTKRSQRGGLVLFDPDFGQLPESINQPLESLQPTMANQFALLTKYFYTDAALTQPIVLPSAVVKVGRISSDSLSNGGFADLNVQGANPFIIAPGVNLSLERSISISNTISSGGAGTANVRAPYISLSGIATSPLPAAGAGQIVFAADLIDLSTILFYGYAETQLVARDIRLGGLVADGSSSRTSSLTTNGRLVLKAGQIYPASGVSASIKAGTEISIEANGEANGLPLSAGGQLTLEAPVIQQNGVLRAPFGSITFNATNRVTLGTGSLTSVSGDGLVMPYGNLSNDESWTDPTKTAANDLPVYLTQPPEKRILFQAPAVNLAAGSVVDVRGGGDLFAWEHVPGPGGSHDVLAMPGVYAIVPSIAGATTPAGAPSPGDRIWLAGGGGVAAGWYTLLPAHYALLPGAFAVSLVAGSQGTGQTNPSVMTDGTVIMKGYRGNAFGGQDQIPSSWRVMSGAVLRQYSEYNETFANSFFASDAFKLAQYRLTGTQVVTPRLPMDGGSLVMKATQELILNGQMLSQAAAGGRGGLMDIAAAKIAIVGAGQDAAALRAAGYLVVDSASLSSFGAGSLLIGGTRSGDAKGLLLDIVASDIAVRNNEATQLVGPEIILAASGTVDIGAGSVIAAKGDAPTGAGDLVMKPQVKAVLGDVGAPDTNPDNDVLLTPSKDYGALVRVSNGDAVQVIRENVDTMIGGIVRIGANARLDGGKALLIDATRNTIVTAGAQISGAALSLASGRIGFGGGSQGQGLILDAASLARLTQTQHLTLRSYSSIDFYTSVNFGGVGLKAVTLDAAGLVGYGDNAIAVTGDTIALANNGASFTQPVGAGHGQLALTANELVLGIGSKTVRGFDSVALSGTARIVSEDNGTVDAGAAALTLATPVLTGRGGSSQSLVTTGALVVAGNGAGEADPADLGLGTRIALTGGSVTFGGRIVALGGAVEMTATNGSVVLNDGARVDVGGFGKQFFDVAEYGNAGRIALTAIGGNVHLKSGAALNLAAASGGGDAGMLALTASGGGTIVLDGQIAAQAGAGGKGGSFTLDIAALPDFAGLSQTLNNAGFDAARQFRIRSGNVVIDGTTTVADFALSADQGSVTLAGTIDARSRYGGRIAISGGNGLIMQPSAVLRAGSTTALGSGRVTLEATGGRLDLQGGTVDVAGGEDGRVRLRALQNASHDGIAVDRLNATITGARAAVLEGVSVYDAADSTHASSFDGVSVDSVMAEAVAHADSFAGHAASILRVIPGGGNVTLAAGIEVRGVGDLTQNTDWNLASLASREGTLTLRAGGNLNIKGNISDGFSTADRSGALLNAASWDLRLVAGADLTSANAAALAPLAALPASSGSLIVGDSAAGKVIRTGTGDIDIRVGRDLQLAHYQSVIYTAGRKDMTTWADFTTAPANAAYGVLGGHLEVVAQGNVSSALPTDSTQNQLFTEWLKRQGETDTSYLFRPHMGNVASQGPQSSWWVDYAKFNQGVGALGGGNVAINAGGDLVNLLVALPTNGRLRGGRTADEQKILEVRNGGAMSVEAGGAVRAGYYYVGRGAGTITAGEITTGRNVLIARPNNRQEVVPIAPVLALGDATLSVKTFGDLRLQTVLDPLLLGTGNGEQGAAYMSGYTDRTSLELTSVGGDVVLVNQAQYLSRNLDLSDALRPVDGKYTLLAQLAGNLYPSITRVNALNGSVINQSIFVTMPGSTPELRILAEKDVLAGEIVMSRATPEMIPSPFRPVGGGGAWIQITNFLGLLTNTIEPSTFYSPQPNHNAYLKSVSNPAHLLNENDYEPSRIYARSGSIIGNYMPRVSGPPTIGSITTSEQTWFRAGTDIRNIAYSLRNLHGTDVSLLEAGNDVIGGPKTGNIRIEGPGALVVSAGRDVYAPELQIFSPGNQQYESNNRAKLGTQILGLPEQGAAITVMAGLKGKLPSYDAFMAAYLDPANIGSMPGYLDLTPGEAVLPDPTALKPGVTMNTVIGNSAVPLYLANEYRLVKGGYDEGKLISFVASETGRTLTADKALEAYKQLPAEKQQAFLFASGTWKMTRGGVVGFVADVTGEKLSPLDAWARFQTLPQLTRERFVRQIYMQGLREAGTDQNMPGVNGLPRNGGYNRGYAAIETLFPGNDWKGDVAMGNALFRTMAGGDIEVLTPGGGLQVAALGTAPAAGYGLITMGYGNVNIFARNNVTVNRSRVLTFAGGDEIVWSTLGDIDAGRGAKTTRVPSAPDIQTDVNAVTKVLENADIAGSGIGTVIGFSGVEEGDVHLIAPEGTVNAGDAGVRVSGNFTLAARFVLNVDNIQVSGQSKGVPKVESKSGPLTVETKDKAAADAVKDATSQAPSERPSVIIVEFLGYGGGDGGSNRPEEDEGRAQRDRRSYNPNSAVQYVGAGSLNDEQRRQLIEEGRLASQATGP